MRVLGSFLRAIYPHLDALIGGILATGLIYAAGWALKGSPMPLWLIYLGICLSLLAACFLAWNDQRNIAEESTKKVEEISKPRLSLTILGTNVGHLEDEKPPTSVVVTATVTNTGAQSIAKKFDASIRLPDGKVLPAAGAHFENLTLQNEDGSIQKHTLADTLSEKTIVPIERNAEKTGPLLFLVDAPRKDIYRPGVEVLLSCVDVFGTVVSASAEVYAGSEQQHRHYPGTRTEFVRPPTPKPQSPPSSKHDL